MKEQITTVLSHWGDVILTLLPALLGGFVDYVNQVQNGSRNWEIAGFFIHLSSAVFFGWLCGMVAFIYATNHDWQYVNHATSASSGMGGFLGVRVADLITWKFFKADRRKDN